MNKIKIVNWTVEYAIFDRFLYFWFASDSPCILQPGCSMKHILKSFLIIFIFGILILLTSNLSYFVTDLFTIRTFFELESMFVVNRLFVLVGYNILFIFYISSQNKKRFISCFHIEWQVSESIFWITFFLLPISILNHFV